MSGLPHSASTRRPGLVGLGGQADVVRAVVGEPDDAAVILRRAIGVAEGEPLEPQHPIPEPARQPVGRAGADASEADHDGLELIARGPGRRAAHRRSRSNDSSQPARARASSPSLTASSMCRWMRSGSAPLDDAARRSLKRGAVPIGQADRGATLGPARGRIRVARSRCAGARPPTRSGRDRGSCQASSESSARSQPPSGCRATLERAMGGRGPAPAPAARFGPADAVRRQRLAQRGEQARGTEVGAVGGQARAGRAGGSTMGGPRRDRSVSVARRGGGQASGQSAPAMATRSR